MISERRDRNFALGFQVVNFVGNLALVGVLVSILSFEDYGLWISINGAGMLLSSVLFGGLGNAAGRFYSKFEGEEQVIMLKYLVNDIIRNLVLLMFISIVVIGILAFTIKEYVQYWSYFLFVMSFSVTNVTRNMLVVRKRRDIVFYAKITELGFKIFTLLFFANYTSNFSVNKLIYIVIISSLLSLTFYIPSICGLVKKIHIAQESEKVRQEVSRFAKPFYLQNLLVWFQQWADKYIILAIVGVELVGEWSFYQQVLVTPFILLSSSIISVYYPQFYIEFDKYKSVEYLKKVLILMLSFMAPILVVMIFYSGLIIRLVSFITSKELSGDIINISAFLALFSVLFPWTDMLYFLKEKTQALTVYKVVRFVFGGVASLIIYKTHSLYLLVFALTISSCLALIFGIRWQRR